MNFEDLFTDEMPPDTAGDSVLEKDTALALLLRLYASNTQNQKYFSLLRRSLQEYLPEIINRDALTDTRERKLVEDFRTLSTKFVEQAQLPQLKNKCLVGIGGRFSAGKSQFINTLTGRQHLPTGQRPTTAVATYLVAQQQPSITAYTANETRVPLVAEELNSIAHVFFDNYGLGFSDILKKIVIGQPDFPWPDIALLDTPGYNNDDEENRGDRLFDEKIAREHLSNCDYVIWLATADNGSLGQSDITFLHSLHLAHPCLVVLNKADGKTADDLRSIVNTFQEQLDNSGIAYYGVTAFSSTLNTEYLDATLLRDFITQACNDRLARQDMKQELLNLQTEWQRMNKHKRDVLNQANTPIKRGIIKSESPQYIRSLVEAYSLNHSLIADLVRQSKAFNLQIDKLLNHE